MSQDTQLTRLNDTHTHSSPASRSPSPPARRARPDSPPPAAAAAAAAHIALPRINDNDPQRRRERQRQMLAQQDAAGDLAQLVPKPRVDPAVEAKRMANTRAGGAYIPPHRLRAMMAEQAQQDEASDEYQRLTWEALRKSINGLVNKVNTGNIKLIVPEVRPSPPWT